MLDYRDYFINDKLLDLKDWKDIRTLIWNCFEPFNLEESKGIRSTPSRSCICALAYFCGQVSQGTLAYFFGDTFLRANINIQVNGLVDAGYLRAMTIPYVGVGSGNVVYTLTQKGYDRYLDHLPDYLKPLNGKIKVKRGISVKANTAADDDSKKSGKPVSSMSAHDYGGCVSFLSAMCLGKKFRYEWEYTQSENGIKEKDMIATDLMIEFAEFPWRIYVEQDTGTERPIVIANKLQRYHLQQLLRYDRDVLIISSFTADRLGFSAGAFHTRNLDSAIELLGKNGLDCISFALAERLTGLKEQECIRTLLSSLRFIKIDKNGYVMNEREDFICPDKCPADNDRLFTIDDLIAFRKSINTGTNPLYFRETELLQQDTCRKRFKSIANVLIADYRATQKSENSMAAGLLEGMQCLCVPSMMLNYYYDDYFFDYKRANCGISRDLYPIVCRLYGVSEPEDAWYRSISKETYSIERIRVRNSFELAKLGRNVAFENISADLGGIMRVVALCDRYVDERTSGMQSFDLDIVCIYETVDSVSLLYEYINPRAFSSNTFGSSGFHIYFMSRENIKNGECVLECSVCDTSTDLFKSLAPIK